MANSLNTDGKMIFMIFVGAIIATVFLGSIADSVNIQTNTVTVTNQSVTAPAVNASVALTGRELVPGTTPVVANSSVNGTLQLQQSGGVFVSTSTVNGLRTVILSVNQTGVKHAAAAVNVSYQYRPDGYLNSSSDRSVALLIVLFGALAILVFVVVVMIKQGSLGKLVGFKK